MPISPSCLFESCEFILFFLKYIMVFVVHIKFTGILYFNLCLEYYLCGTLLGFEIFTCRTIKTEKNCSIIEEQNTIYFHLQLGIYTYLLNFVITAYFSYCKCDLTTKCRKS